MFGGGAFALGQRAGEAVAILGEYRRGDASYTLVVAGLKCGLEQDPQPRVVWRVSEQGDAGFEYATGVFGEFVEIELVGELTHRGLERGEHQGLFVAEIVVDQRQVHAGVVGDRSRRGGAPAFGGDERDGAGDEPRFRIALVLFVVGHLRGLNMCLTLLSVKTNRTRGNAVNDQHRRLAVVAGATGYLGRHVVRTLHETGWRVRALARDPERLGDEAAFADEVFIGEATEPESIARLCEGANAVVSSLGVRHFRRHPTIWDVDWLANLNVVQAAESAGVEQFVFVSFLGADQLRTRVPVAEARERVVDVLRSSSMHATVLRPTGFFNDMHEFLRMALRGRVWLVGDGHARINPIDGADVADVVREVLWEGNSAPAEIAIGGPDVLSLDEIGRMACEAAGHAPRLGHVPAWVLPPVVAASRMFGPNAHAFSCMFAELAHGDAVAPAVGRRHLHDFYRACMRADAGGGGSSSQFV